MNSQPRRPARQTRKVLSFAAMPRPDHGGAFTLETVAPEFPTLSKAARGSLLARLAKEGWLERVWKGGGGMHHWKHSLYKITADGRLRLEFLNQDKRI